MCRGGCRVLFVEEMATAVCFVWRCGLAFEVERFLGAGWYGGVRCVGMGAVKTVKLESFVWAVYVAVGGVGVVVGCTGVGTGRACSYCVAVCRCTVGRTAHWQ